MSNISHQRLFCDNRKLLSRENAIKAKDIICNLRNNAKMDYKLIDKMIANKRGEKSRLAKFIGIDADKLSKSIKGKRNFKLEEIAKIAEFFDIPLDRVLKDDPKRNKLDDELQNEALIESIVHDVCKKLLASLSIGELLDKKVGIELFSKMAAILASSNYANTKKTGKTSLPTQFDVQQIIDLIEKGKLILQESNKSH